MSEETYYRILKQITLDPCQSQRQMAGNMGISLGKVNYCIQGLMQKGWVKVKRFHNSNNKRAYLYQLTPEGLHAKSKLTVRFLNRKMEEYENLRKEIEELKQETETLAEVFSNSSSKP